MSDTGDTPPGIPGPLPKQANDTINDACGTPPCTPRTIVIPPTTVVGDAIGNPRLAPATVHGNPGPPAQPATGTLNDVPPSMPGPPAIPATDTINNVRGNQTNVQGDNYNINVTIVSPYSTSGELICFKFI